MEKVISEKTTISNWKINWDILELLWAKQYENDYVITPSIRDW